MNVKFIRETFDNLPAKRKKVLLLLLAGKSRNDVMDELELSQNALAAHLRELYKNFDINTDFVGDRRSGERKLPLLINLFAKHMPELIGQNQTSSDSQNNTDSELEKYYKLLENELVSQKWQQADQLTAAIMMEVANRYEKGWLETDDFLNFPCSVLVAIDNLWVKYSHGQFGFSVQQKIWSDIGGKPNADPQVFEEFSRLLGWVEVYQENSDNSIKTKERCLKWGELNFTLTAPEGHLPTPPRWWELWEGFLKGEDFLFYKLNTCLSQTT